MNFSFEFGRSNRRNSKNLNELYDEFDYEFSDEFYDGELQLNDEDEDDYDL